jgi:hypothetical protein
MRFSMHRKEWMRASRRVHCGSAGGCTVRVFVYAAATGVYDDVKIIVPNDARVVVVTKFNVNNFIVIVTVMPVPVVVKTWTRV